jgi:hypothetical protein
MAALRDASACICDMNKIHVIWQISRMWGKSRAAARAASAYNHSHPSSLLSGAWIVPGFRFPLRDEEVLKDFVSDGRPEIPIPDMKFQPVLLQRRHSTIPKAMPPLPA